MAQQPTRFVDQWGWQGIALSKIELAYQANLLADRLESVEWSDALDKTSESILRQMSQNVDTTISTIVPNLFGGASAPLNLATFLLVLAQRVETIIPPSQFTKALTISPALGRAVRAAESRLGLANSSIDGIDSKLKAINDAHDAAEQLPTTLDDIRSALAEVEVARAAIAEQREQHAVFWREAAELKKSLDSAKLEADTVLARVQASYRAVTSQGLAHAFSQKASELNRSMLVWVLLLLGSLVAASLLGHARFPEILAAVSGKPDWGVVLINIVLGFVSVAPPVWVAWHATIQIGQRFRLAEDYGYKAALSAAYEGYRSEAEKIDPLFEAQLFATALGRLDELPLRYVETSIPGSPWHQLLMSNEFKTAMEKVPELKQRVVDFMKGNSKEIPAASEAKDGG